LSPDLGLAMKAWKNVDAYMAAAPKDVQVKLREVRAAVREAAPDAVESISYGMPFYSFKGETGFKARLCYFGLLKNRIAFYMRPMAIEGHLDEVSEYQTTKSALQFPLDRPIPVSLIKKLVREGIKKHVAGEDDSRASGGKLG
jgi:uncharacterized protein YdhG (YjbR/CyaY superfamily)